MLDEYTLVVVVQDSCVSLSRLSEIESSGLNGTATNSLVVKVGIPSLRYMLLNAVKKYWAEISVACLSKGSGSR